MGNIDDRARAVINMDASEDLGLACPQYLLARVCGILHGDCDVDTSELVQIIKHIGSTSVNLTEDANSLVEDAMTADGPTHGDTTRKDMGKLLKMFLRDRPEIQRMNRKIKEFVYSLHVQALTAQSGPGMRSPGECMTLSQQEELLLRALRCGGVGDSQADDSESALHVLDSVSSTIASTYITKSPNEIQGVKAKKRVKKARQKIHKHCFTMTWVVMEDVIDMVKAEGVKSQAEVERRAQRIWKEECFPLDIYHTAEGQEGTQAEFMCNWLRSGQSWAECKTRLATLSLSAVPKREVSPSFRVHAMKRLRENAAKTYKQQTPVANTTDATRGAR